MEPIIENAENTPVSVPADISFNKQFSKDITIPDFCADIGRCADVSSEVFPKEVTLSDGKINVYFEIAYTVIYYDRSGTGMHKYTVSDDLSASFDVKGDGVMLLAFDITSGEPAVKLSGTRKLTLRTDCIFGFTVCKKTPVPVLDIKDGDRQLQKKRPLLNVQRKTLIPASINDDIRIPDVLPPVSEIISCKTYIGCARCEYEADKIKVTGDMMICITYFDEDGEIFCHSDVLPITSLTDGELAFGAQMIPSFYVKEQRYGANTDEKGESRIVSVDMTVGIDIRILENTDCTYTADTYSTECEAEPSFETLCCGALEGVNFSSETLTETVDDEIERAAQIRAKACIRRSRIEAGKLYAEGNCDVIMLAKLGTGGYSTFEKSIPFEYSCDVSDECDGASVFACASGADVSAGKVLSVDVDITVSTFSKQGFECVSGINRKECEKREDGSFSLYYVDDGESLWDIAKAHRVSVEDICRENGIEDIGDKRMIIIP